MKTLSHPFDAAASSYDAVFTTRRLGRWLREMVHDYLARTFRAGDHILELNCGTGEDAIWLAKRGVRVTATDVSLDMLKQAQNKVEAAKIASNVQFAHLDLNSLDTFGTSDASRVRQYDGAFSNFGGLNCVAERRPLVKMLARVVRPGGYVILVPMGPLCPWEIGWCLTHGQVRTAFRRLGSDVEAHLGKGRTIRVWYPSPHQLRSEFASHFHHVRTIGIGTFLPPSYLDHLVERWPNLFERLAKVDKQIGRFFPWTWLNDHYLVIVQRR